ncbi:MAG: hypothetical protein WAL59_19155 [Roseiarcus sp.]
MPKLHGAHVKLEDAANQVAEIGAYRDKFPLHWETSLKLEGVMRTLGQHAAGVVVGACDLRERARRCWETCQAGEDMRVDAGIGRRGETIYVDFRADMSRPWEDRD